MTQPHLPMSGACLCGAVRVRVTEPPLLAAVCHCPGCQKMSASAFSATLVVPTDGFEATGETVIGGEHRANAHHHHCPRCKCWVFTRIEPEQGFVNLRATMLDDHAWFRPFLESYTSTRLPWATTGAERSYPEFPPMEDYPAIIQAYAASR